MIESEADSGRLGAGTGRSDTVPGEGDPRTLGLVLPGRRIVVAEFRWLLGIPNASLSHDERRSKAFLEIELAMLSGAPVSGRLGAWIGHLQELEVFVQRWWTPTQNSRRPEMHSPEVRFLADWFRRQRRAARDERLCSYQLERLQSLHGPFVLNHSDYHWDNNFRTYRRFLRLHSRPPRLAAINMTEPALARWAVRQRFLYRKEEGKGKLSKDRVDRLESLTIWSWGRENAKDPSRRPTRVPNLDVWFPLHPKACRSWHEDGDRESCIAANVARRTRREVLSCHRDAPKQQ